MATNPDGSAPKDTAERDRVLTVSALNQRSRQLLENHFSQVWVEGEISNLARPSSGHWYFTLKDAKAQVRCAMFRNRNQLLRFRPENGMQVIVRGRLSLYEARGDYQLIGENMREAGVGDLQRAFEQLKQNLAARGWFDSQLKRPLPTLPAHIGVVTSPSGAALHDILTVLQRRFPAIAVTIVPTVVQGATAAAAIASAIAQANRVGRTLQPPLDALIVARGGGSLEDLWAFNEEAVAAAIYSSELPVVSAVGHETDFSIADFVADHRAPTPSAAAEMLSPDRVQWRQTLQQQRQRLDALLLNAVTRQQQRLQHLKQRLKHPGAQLREYSQRLDETEIRLVRALERLQRRLTDQLEYARQRLWSHSPARTIPALNTSLNQQQARLVRAAERLLAEKQQRLQQRIEVLDSVSPLGTLRRGYAIVQNTDGKVVSDSEQLAEGDTIHLRLDRGKVDARVLRLVDDTRDTEIGSK